VPAADDGAAMLTDDSRRQARIVHQWAAVLDATLAPGGGRGSCVQERAHPVVRLKTVRLMVGERACPASGFPTTVV